MRKTVLRLSLGVGVALLVMIGLPTAVANSPASPPSSGIADNSPWFTSIQIQNPTTETASVQVEYYDQTGTVVMTSSYAIPAGATHVIWQDPPPGIPGLPAGFAGSAVISSNKPVIAVVNEVGDGIFGSHNGVSDIATTVYLPLIMRGYGGWDTWFGVQNAGTDTANVTIDFFYENSATVVHSITDTIPAGASHYYDQTDSSFSGLGSPFVGSAVISSTQPMAAAVNESDGSGLLTYNGFGSGSQTVNLPLIMKGNYDWYTSMAIQNLHASEAATVVVKYYEEGNPTPVYTVTETIQPHAMELFWQDAPPGIPGLPEPFVGSAVAECTTGQPIAAIVNELFLAGIEGMSFSGFGTATTKVFLPLIMKDNWGWHTSIQIQNLDSVDTATVEVSYYEKGSSSPYYIDTVTIPPGAVEVFWQDPPPGIPELPAGFVGSAVAESTTGQHIVAVVNEVCKAPDCPAGESSSSYNGFNQ